LGNNWNVLLLQLRHFGVNVGPTARVSPEMMQTAQQEMTGTAQMYIKELWNLPIASILIGFVIYFIGGYFHSSFTRQLAPQ
jgi:ABC-2 type transport system permease protein